jgi:hypothetical protein
MSTNRVKDIEDALVAALKARSSCDFLSVDGVMIARFYDYSPSSYGGATIAVELNLTAIAIDVERALS